MTTPTEMRSYSPKFESAEMFTNGKLVWLQEVIKDKDGDLVVKRTLSNKHRPLNEKYQQSDIDKIRAMNNSLGIYYGGRSKTNKRKSGNKSKKRKSNKRRSNKRSRKFRTTRTTRTHIKL